jgi:lysophospholipase L1-like esterase
MRHWLVGLGFLVTLGCNGENTDDDTKTDTCKDEASLEGNALFGQLYWDADASDESRHAYSYDASADAAVMGSNVKLMGSSGVEETSSCENGSFAFENLAEGSYVLGVEHEEAQCMQRNCTQRFPTAIEEGNVTIVTFGDSVPKIGDAPMFPDRLATLIGDLAEVDNRNVAVPGTLSTDWVPGTNNFENKVKPNVAEADVIIISVGGNDITSSLDASALQNIDQAIEDTYALVADIVVNIKDMADEIRSINPDVDIVYCLYVDYGTATIQPWGLASAFLPEGTITNILMSAREQVPSDSNIILADLFGASQKLTEPLDEYLYDALHFNDKGQTMYAEEVFQSLGGVLVGPSPIGGSPSTPLNLRPHYSYSE